MKLSIDDRHMATPSEWALPYFSIPLPTNRMGGATSFPYPTPPSQVKSLLNAAGLLDGVKIGPPTRTRVTPGNTVSVTNTIVM